MWKQTREPNLDLCSVDECNRTPEKRGYCGKHYQRLRVHGDVSFVAIKRGENRSSNPLYRVYAAMKRRCYNKNTKDYSEYGGRGISLCDEWLGIDGFTNFLRDMGERPSVRHSIDRIDNEQGYSPSNCRWATIHQQTSNRRTNNKVVGVHWNTRISRWKAVLEVNRRIVLSKTFTSYDDAVNARLNAEKEFKIYVAAN